MKIISGQLKKTPISLFDINPKFKSPPIPKQVLQDFKEAAICLGNNAPKACIVMCGRALEGLTIDKNAEGRYLASKIKYLYDNNLISNLLFDAFTKIRTFRNIGAHPQLIEVIEEGEDKKNFDITNHVIEHVYILPELCE